MKLKNKKTGEIGYFRFANWDDPVLIIMDKNGVQLAKYNSLAKLNDEWEDYEESKKYWFINAGGEISSIYEEDEDEEDTKSCEEIGNYFETKEEAKKAVEKLKAWKRLKDKGFKIQGWGFKHDEPGIRIKTNCPPDSVEELDLLFGGEE